MDAATGREQGEGEPIDGKAFAAGLRQRTGKGLAALVAKGGARSRLATALVCADPASQVSEQASKANLLALIAKLSAHAPVKGVLVQCRRLAHLGERAIPLAASKSAIVPPLDDTFLRPDISEE